MSNTQGDLAALSRFIFQAPSWYASAAFSLVIAALAGVAVFDSRFLLEDAWRGVFFIGVPTVVAGLVTPWLDRLVGGRLTPNRSQLLALVCELVVIGLLLTAGVATRLSASLSQYFVFEGLVAGLASIFALRLLVILSVSRARLTVAILPASIQTVAGAVFLFVYSGTITYFEVGGPILRSYLSRPEQAPPELSLIGPELFTLLAITCGLYVGAVYLFLLVIDRPWRRSLGVSVLDFIRGFIGHVTEGSRELESFFEQLGEDAVVPVTVLAFRTAAGEKARFVLPMVHPGPMGKIGGGNLPERVAAAAEGMAFAPHATAGHDFNLVTQQEVQPVLDAADRDRLQLGVAWEETDWGPADGIGPLGIRVAVLEVDGQRTAWVLVDGNNVAPGLRDRIVETLEAAAVTHAELLTTDTHIVNSVSAVNQVGDGVDHDALVAVIERLTRRAIADIEPVEGGMATDRAEVRVFGNDRTETLASHANAMLSMGGALAGAFIMAISSVSLLIFLLT